MPGSIISYSLQTFVVSCGQAHPCRKVLVRKSSVWEPYKALHFFINKYRGLPASESCLVVSAGGRAVLSKQESMERSEQQRLLGALYQMLVIRDEYFVGLQCIRTSFVARKPRREAAPPPRQHLGSTLGGPSLHAVFYHLNATGKLQLRILKQ